MGTPLKILMLEDTQEDVDLIERELKQGGMSFISTVVNTKDDFERSLAEIKPDIILADHSLPQFNSIDALKILQQYACETKNEIPFILVTGSISEEFVAEIINLGADDYILKDRLKRLPTAVQNALSKTKVENERTEYLNEIISKEGMMREAEQLAHFGSWQVDLLTGAHKWSDETYRIFGYEPGGVKVTYETFLNHIYPKDRQSLKTALEQTVLHRQSYPCEYRIVDRTGKVKHLLSNILVKRDHDQRAIQLTGFNMDITQQKKQTAALALQNKKLIEIAWIQSHEVRAPLARIMGLIQLIERGESEENKSNTFWKPLLESAHELDSIIRKIVTKTEAIGGTETGKK
jgi:two-component system response regulator